MSDSSTKRFQELVELLKSKRVIKKDIDLAIDIGVTKGALSNMLTGKRKISDSLLEHFKEIYKDHLLENKVFKEDDCAQKLLHAEKQIELMSKTIAALEDHIATLKKQKN